MSLIAIKISVPCGNYPPVFVLTYGNAVKQSTLWYYFRVIQTL